MKSTASATYYLDTRIKDSGYGIIKILITYKRKQRLHTTGLKIAEADWKKLQRSIDQFGLSGKVKNQGLIDLYNTLYINENSSLKLSEKIISHLGDNFSFENFKYYFDNPQVSFDNQSEFEDDVIIALQRVSEALLQDEKISTSSGYGLAAKSLVRFIDSLGISDKNNLSLPDQSQGVRLPFHALSADFLKSYEKWMLKSGKFQQKKGAPPGPASINTIGIYLRYVRAVCNTAIEEGIMPEKSYPFSKNKYTIPSEKGEKMALKKSDIDKILNYIPVEGYESRSWCIWVFSYLSNGMNISDICRLKWENIDFKNKSIDFIRAKTKSTTRGDIKKITTMLFPQLENIINAIGSRQHEYVFPFLNGVQSELRKKRITNQLIKVTNKHMNIIAEKLGIDANLDSYSARHSFATILLQSNAPIPFISKALGHSSFKTTETYLAGFKDEQVKDFLSNLI